MPLLSIIVPIYNVSKYIEDCVISLFSAASNDVEFLFIDDKTQDDSLDKLLSVISNNPHLENQISILRHTINQGLSAARNTGLREATGDYVWFVDSDDWLKNNSLDIVLSLIKKFSVDVFVTPLDWIIEGEFDGKKDIFVENDLQLKGKSYFLKKYPSGASPRFIIKREFLIENELYFVPGILHEDGEFGPRMLMLAQQVYVIKEPLYNYRIRASGSIMSSWSKKNSDDLIFIYNNLSSFGKERIADKSDRVHYDVLIFNILLSSIFFAKKYWKTSSFIDFYNENKKFIRREAFKQLFKCGKVKTSIKHVLILISPLWGCKIINKL